MNCANCGEEIYWDHDILGRTGFWVHLDSQTILCPPYFMQLCPSYFMQLMAEPKIDKEVKKDVCKHCGYNIYYYGNEWVHIYKKTFIISCGLGNDIKAEPKDDLIILDEVKPIPTDCIECDHKYLSSDGYTLTGICSILTKDNVLFEDSGLRDHVIPKNLIPPTWCPLKVKEPEKLYCNGCDRRKVVSTGVTSDKWFCRFGEKIIGEFTTGSYIPRPDWCVHSFPQKQDLCEYGFEDTLCICQRQKDYKGRYWCEYGETECIWKITNQKRPFRLS